MVSDGDFRTVVSSGQIALQSAGNPVRKGW
jgi:hypothetical protein